MPENQKIEWKSSWCDEYLEWICGFANAQGGTLVIGKDDHGNTVGAKKSERLLVDIPNKVKNAMGIVVDVNLLAEGEKTCVEVAVQPYPTPITYKGKLYYRSGSTNQLLQGADLERFMLMKRGRTWDMTPLPNVQVSDLDDSAIARFKGHAINTKRLDQGILGLSTEELLDKLSLLEDGSLTMAAVLLFHNDAEKWVPGSFLKMGFFEDEVDILYQDDVYGPLIDRPDKVIGLLYSKYLRAIVSYEGINRVERFPFPEAAVREAVLNALANKRYESGIPIQLRVYDDRLILANEGRLPDNWTVETLMSSHRSVPYNPLIAKVFYYAGFIENWGRGIEKIFDACKADGIPEPVYDLSKGGVMLYFSTAPERVIKTFKGASDNTGTVRGQVGRESGRKNGRKSPQAKGQYGALLTHVARHPDATIAELSLSSGITERSVRRLIKDLKDTGVLVREGSNRKGVWVIVDGDGQNS